MTPTKAALARICRYPLKGFAGQDLSAADLRTGGGIDFDRHLAVVSGNRPETPTPGGWVPSRTFVQNTVFDGLLRIACRFEENRGLMHLERPQGDTISLRLGDAQSLGAANRSIADWFANGPHGAIRLVEQQRGHGFWDYTDSVLSIINLASIRNLEDRAGRPIDPTRFRGNLYMDGAAPWEEFAWIGGTLRIGGTTLQIIRPILRCAATSVDPTSGERDFNLPGFMQQQFGHCFCGVYARVIAGGAVQSGDPISFDGIAGASVEPQPENAPPRNKWPRYETVTLASSEGTTKPFLTMPSFVCSSDECKPDGVSIRVHNLPSQVPSWASIAAKPGQSGNAPGWFLTLDNKAGAEAVRALVEKSSPILVSGPF